jgi:hypothetical protein
VSWKGHRSVSAIWFATYRLANSLSTTSVKPATPIDARVVSGVEAMPSNTETNPSSKTLTESNRPPFAPHSSLAAP